MITIRLNGGLGNQMFQFAAASALARRHRCRVGVDIVELRRSRNRSYMLDRLNVPQEGLLQSHAHNRLRRFLGIERSYREPHFHFDPAFHGLAPPVTLSGYFQSERYFADIADTLRTMYAPRAPFSPQIAAVAEAIQKSRTAVAVHVRRGDYVSDPATARVHASLDPGYYRRAIDSLRARIGGEAEFFMFSDDPAYVEETFSFLRDRTVVRGDTQRPWEDMALMACCRHHVIANSSFSWWGAWLAGAADQIVIAPRTWFTPHASADKSLKDLYPPRWMVM